MNLPKDPFILYSVINTKLRDVYPSLDALCDVFCVNKQDIVNTIEAIGFEYDPSLNKFV